MKNDHIRRNANVTEGERSRQLREDFRPPTAREREILEMLLSVEIPGIAELRAQLPYVSVARWNCGCASFDVAVEKARAPRASITTSPAVEATTRERADITRTYDLLLWVRDGWLAAVEIVDYVDRHGEDSPAEIPSREEWNAPEGRSAV